MRAIHVITRLVVLLALRVRADNFYENLGLNADANISINEIEFTF